MKFEKENKSLCEKTYKRLKIELEKEQLVIDFPLTYRNWTGAFAGPGWNSLIRRLSEKIEAELLKLVTDPEYFENPFQVIQIKEKFGTLRFYTNWETDEIGKAIQEAEDESAVTCERCGAVGKLRGRGWVYVACLEHTQLHDLNKMEKIKSFFYKWRKKMRVIYNKEKNKVPIKI